MLQISLKDGSEAKRFLSSEMLGSLNSPVWIKRYLDEESTLLGVSMAAWSDNSDGRSILNICGAIHVVELQVE